MRNVDKFQGQTRTGNFAKFLIGKTIKLTENVLLLKLHVIKTYVGRKYKAPCSLVIASS
jgi:hypothetical protein